MNSKHNIPRDIKVVPVVPLFSSEHSKGKILALNSQELKTGK